MQDFSCPHCPHVFFNRELHILDLVMARASLLVGSVWLPVPSRLGWVWSPLVGHQSDVACSRFARRKHQVPISTVPEFLGVSMTPWGYPKGWMVYFMENSNLKWMMTGGSPMTKRKPPHGSSQLSMKFLKRFWFQSTSHSVCHDLFFSFHSEWSQHGNKKNCTDENLFFTQ